MVSRKSGDIAADAGHDGTGALSAAQRRGRPGALELVLDKISRDQLLDGG